MRKDKLLKNVKEYIGKESIARYAALTTTLENILYNPEVAEHGPAEVLSAKDVEQILAPL